MQPKSESDAKTGSTRPRTSVAKGPAAGASVLDRIQRALPGLESGLRLLADGLPAPSGLIDVLGVDAAGRPVLVFVVEGAHADDGRVALGLARALGARAWLQSEQPGWLQLVPEIARSDVVVPRCLLLVRSLSPMLRAAIEALPDRWIEPVVYRPFSHGGDDFLLLEQLAPPAPDTARGASEPDGDPRPTDPPTADGPPLPPLRSRLTEADFRADPVSQSAQARPRFEPAEDRAPDDPPPLGKSR